MTEKSVGNNTTTHSNRPLNPEAPTWTPNPQIQDHHDLLPLLTILADRLNIVRENASGEFNNKELINIYQTLEALNAISWSIIKGTSKDRNYPKLNKAIKEHNNENYPIDRYYIELLYRLINLEPYNKNQTDYPDTKESIINILYIITTPEGELTEYFVKDRILELTKRTIGGKELHPLSEKAKSFYVNHYLAETIKNIQNTIKPIRGAYRLSNANIERLYRKILDDIRQAESKDEAGNKHSHKKTRYRKSRHPATISKKGDNKLTDYTFDDLVTKCCKYSSPNIKKLDFITKLSELYEKKHKTDIAENIKSIQNRDTQKIVKAARYIEASIKAMREQQGPVMAL
ncbi:MAG: hypothetical protein AAF195_04855 [Pseudomonadota bacterium]